MAKSLLEMASEMVASQASSTSLTAEQMAESLEKVYSKLQHLHKLAEAPADRPKVGAISPPSRSIQRHKVVCLECGQEFRQLTKRHLALHAMSPREYRLKWGFPTTMPLACRVLVEKRSETAKRLGLVEKALAARRKKAAEKAKAEKAKAAKAKPKAKPKARTAKPKTRAKAATKAKTTRTKAKAATRGRRKKA
jgi:predicted transcriptional regulator